MLFHGDKRHLRSERTTYSTAAKKLSFFERETRTGNNSRKCLEFVVLFKKSSNFADEIKDFFHSFIFFFFWWWEKGVMTNQRKTDVQNFLLRLSLDN